MLNKSFAKLLPSSSIALPQNDPLKTSNPLQKGSSLVKTEEIFPREQGENFALFR